MKEIKKKPQNNGKFNKKTNFKSKKGQQQIKKSQAPSKPEIRKMMRQQAAAKAEAERLKAKEEKDARVKEYKKKRLDKTKALCKRTKYGQPLMKDRIELLLKQIQEQRQ